jgi:hypothetical protein
MNEEII